MHLLLWCALLLGASAVTTLSPWDGRTATERCNFGRVYVASGTELDFEHEAGSGVEGRYSLLPFGLVCDYHNGDRTKVVSIAAAPAATPFVGFCGVMILGSATYLVATFARRRRSLRGQ